MKEKVELVKLVGITLLKAIYLTGLSSLFGGMQVFAIYVLSQISTDIVFSGNEIYLTGFPLFFSIALLSAILIEYFIIEKIKTNPLLNSLILVVCICVGFFSMLVFGKIFLQKETLDLEKCIIFQNIIIGFTLYITLTLKSLIILKERVS